MMARLMFVTCCWLLIGCAAESPPESPSTSAGSLDPGGAVPRSSEPGTPTGPIEPAGGVQGRGVAGGPEHGLTLSIQLESAAKTPAISIEKPFSVVLKNTSDQPIRIGHPSTEKGYYQLSLQFTDSRSGKVHVGRKRPVDDADFWKAMSQEIEPGSEFVEIAPGDDFQVQVVLNDFKWGEREWTGLPSPNSQHPYSVRAQYESLAAADDAGRKNWMGKIQSDSVDASLIAPGLKTPHDYLWNGFPEKAIELMTADPKWINARAEDDECTPLASRRAVRPHEGGPMAARSRSRRQCNRLQRVYAPAPDG